MLVILLNLNLSMSLLAQQDYIKFECFSVEQGLSQNGVYSIIQDSQGFMWFATQSGLSRYDGYNFTVYSHTPFDSTSLSDVWIDDIFEDHFGNIWVATANNGLNMFNRETEQFTHYKHDPDDQSSLSHHKLHSIYEDRSGTLWIGTERGLDKFDRETGQFVHYKHDPNNPGSLSGNIVLSIFEDRSGTLWIGTAYGGLNKLVRNPDSVGKGSDRETGQFVHYKHDPNNPKSLGNNRVRSIYEDWSGAIWLGTRRGLSKLDKETGNFTSYYHDPTNPKSLSHNILWSIYVDGFGTLWVGTSGGLNKFDRETEEFAHYIHDPLDPNSLSDNRILSIYEDRSGTLWVGTFSGGVCKQNRNKAKFHHYKHDPADPNSLSDDMVWSMFEDRSGILWIGTNEGLNKFDREAGKFTHYRHDSADPNSLSYDIVTAIYEDPDTAGRKLWVGTLRGLDKLALSPDSYGKGSDTQAGKKVHYKHDSDNPASLTSGTIRSLYVDRSDNLWVGTFGDLNRLVLSPDSVGKAPDMRNEQFIRYQNDPSDPNSLSNWMILAIYEDKSGTIWIGTEGGLNKFDRETGQFTQYKHNSADPRSLSNDVVNSIYEDPNSGTNDERILWVGTSKGLNKFYPERGTFRHYFKEDGLSDDLVYGVLGDDAGNLWMSTNRGLSRFDPRTETFKNYDPSDGVQSLEFNGGAYFKSRSGELFFGGINGFNAFYPDSIKDNPHIPPVVLTDFRIFDKPAELDQSLNTIEEVELSYKQNFFSFEFAALDYTTPEKNQYAYTLEGLDDDWIYSGTRRYASYTNLPDGEYVFRAKGSNNDGIWNEEGISLRITILPPWWETSLAYALYVMMIGSSVFGLWRFQINRLNMRHELEMEHFEANKLREMDEVKSRFFANISHEFRTPLTLILGPLEKMLSKDKRDEKERMDLLMMKRSGGRLLRLINQLLDLSKIESGDMSLKVKPEDVIMPLRGIVNSFLSLAERKKITLEFNTSEEPIVLYIDRDKFEKILINLLSNAFKFTPEGGTVSVNISVNTDINDESDRKIGVNGYVSIEVSDTGRGIAPDQLDKVFDRFYQVDASHTREQEGTGIGLALTKDLVELHKGTVSVSSEEGKGTVFVVRLPLGKDHLQESQIVEEPSEEAPKTVYNEAEIEESLIEETVRSEKKATKRAKSKPILLIVEDNTDVRRYMRDYLDDSYRVMEAKDGVEGYEMSTDTVPDLIISDVMMPKMDGIEMCEKIKKDERTSHIPVILLTAKADMESKLEGLETGADSYLTKPFDPKELLIRANNLIEQRRKLREHFMREAQFKPKDIAVTSTDEKFLHRAIDIIEERMSDSEFSVYEFSREIGMSRVHLHRKLRALTDQSPRGFIRTLRLWRAASLLRQKFGNVTEVAFEVGFDNLSYFAQCFRKQFGELPSEYSSE